MPAEPMPYCVFDKRLNAVVANAARKWNKAMRDLAYFYPARTPSELPVISIGFGPVDKTGQPDRIAQATWHDEKQPDQTQVRKWVITLDSAIKWNTSTWFINFQSGEIALAAVMHEIGHTLGFGHSEVFSSVMHKSCGTTVISVEDAAALRVEFLSRNK